MFSIFFQYPLILSQSSSPIIIITQLNKSMKQIFILFLIVVIVCADIRTQTDQSLDKLRSDRYLRGIQLQITKGKNIVYNYNIGEKNSKSQPIDNSTVAKIASLSKSFASVAAMQHIQSKKINLNSTLSEILGFQVKNPYFPQVKITLQMVMSHQSSIVDCDPTYTNFLSLTGAAKTGLQVPLLKDLLVKGGKYYGDCIFSKKRPGTYFNYSNFNYGIIGTVIQKVSNIRFDIYTRQNILKYLTTNQTEIPTFAAWMLANHNNLATLYRGNDKGDWLPQSDYYPSGIIPTRNVTDYVVGSNGLLFSPQAGLRASVTHMCNYVYMLANKGVTKQGHRILSAQSVTEIIRPRYQFYGLMGGQKIDYHHYGLGLFTSGLSSVDRIFDHEVVVGHTGDSYGLISAYYFWRDYTLSYYFTGNLKGYTPDPTSFYQKQRTVIHQIVKKFYLNFEQAQQSINISSE